MLFFETDFLLLFLAPLVVLAALLTVSGFSNAAVWLASIASLAFLFANSNLSVAVAIFSITLNYFGARYLLRNRQIYIYLSIVTINLMILGYFKYSILIENSFFGHEASWTWRIALPLGISFYTFQQIAFVSDVYEGRVKSFKFRTYALFKLFFPQFIAGPIVHYERVRSSYERWPTFNARSIRYGLTLFAIGMIKKLIGDWFGVIANEDFSNPKNLDMFSAWAGMLAFTFQIYFDFSGYSDMALGLARLFGVSLPFNFNSPYKARNLSDFWRRWHITLSRWLRDYLYIGALGGNRQTAARTALALLLTMALGGLWHGAGWHFVGWGVAHGLALIAVRYAGFDVPRVLGQILTFIFVMLTWVLFRADDFSSAIDYYQALLNFADLGVGVELARVANLIMPMIPVGGMENKPEQIMHFFAIIVALIWCTLLPNSQQIALWFSARKIKSLGMIEIPALLFIVFAISLAFVSPEKSNAFIYFEF